MTEVLTIDRPISGDITRSGTSRVPQEGPAAFLEAIDNVLAQDGVLSIHWDQYTPYFNDGEACEFGTGEVYVRLEDRFNTDEEREDAKQWGTMWEDGAYMEERLGAFDQWSLRGDNWKNPEYKVNGQDTKAIHDALDALDLSKFENVVLDNFGDHAQVTATREGFNVEYYDHE